MKLIFTVALIVLASFSVEAGSWEKKKFQDLEFEIYRPVRMGSVKSALMLTLHGCTQKAGDFAKNGNWTEASEKFSAIIVAPYVPKGGVKMGCWDYYGTNHQQGSRHHKVLFELIQTLLKDKTLNIDSRRVYVSGLSSGGGEALLLACLRPDLIAGAGLASSPAVPSEAHEISKPQLTAQDMIRFCHNLAGSNAKHFPTQMTSVIVADQDFVVSTDHSKVIVESMVTLSKASLEKELDLKSVVGTNQSGEAWIYLNQKGGARVSYIINKGIGHNWAAGAPPGGAFITQNSINYPLYLLSFFENFNPRLSPKAFAD